MGKTEGMPKKIKYKYIFPDDYNPQYATGAWGGLVPSGEIIINFFLERHGLPLSQTFGLGADGKIGPEVAREPEDHAAAMVRYVTNGVVLSLSSARMIHEWLGKHIELAAKAAEPGGGATPNRKEKA